LNEASAFQNSFSQNPNLLFARVPREPRLRAPQGVGQSSH